MEKVSEVKTLDPEARVGGWEKGIRKFCKLLIYNKSPKRYSFKPILIKKCISRGKLRKKMEKFLALG